MNESFFLSGRVYSDSLPLFPDMEDFRKFILLAQCLFLSGYLTPSSPPLSKKEIFH